MIFNQNDQKVIVALQRAKAIVKELSGEEDNSVLHNWSMEQDNELIVEIAKMIQQQDLSSGK